VAEADAALGEVVRREFERDAVSRQDADVMLAHLAGRIGDQFVAVVQGDAKARVGQHLVDHTLHFDQFFLGHMFLAGEPLRERGAFSLSVEKGLF